MTNYTRRTHTDQTTDTFILNPPVPYSFKSDHVTIGHVSIWWARRTGDDWTVSLGCTTDNWPYNERVFLSSEHPELLDLFADLIKQTNPNLVADVQRAKDRHPAYLVKSDGSHVDLVSSSWFPVAPADAS